MSLEKFKRVIDPLIDSFIQKKIDELPKDRDFIFLANYFKYLKDFIKDGKRIRPYVAYITYLSFGGKNNKDLIKNLVFLEIFHYFCLVHDDIMDNSKKRHGIKTVNEKFGNSEAILLGDYLFSWAWEILLAIKLDDDRKEKLISLFRETVDDVFLGQILDVDSTHKKIVSNDLILKKTLHKTAGYSFIKPMLIGLLLTKEYNNENKKFCNKLGKNLGLAFQIQDDLLDITSDFKGNKTPLKDITEGTHTIFSNYVFKNGSNKEKEILAKNFGKNINNPEEVKKVFYDSGAIEYGKKLFNSYINKSTELAMNHKYFLDLIEILKGREK
jgi:geranylgeranyl pyrophosphate synthase